MLVSIDIMVCVAGADGVPWAVQSYIPSMICPLTKNVMGRGRNNGFNIGSPGVFVREAVSRTKRRKAGGGGG